MKELNLYGSSRLGQIKDTALVYDNAEITPHFPDSIFNHTMGIRNYEVSNHLGNVLAVVSDRKTPIEDGSNPGEIGHYEPYARFRGDYYPYGMLMPERTFVEHCKDTIEYDTTFVVNHDFNSGTNGWLGGNCTLATDNGRLHFDKCTAANDSYATLQFISPGGTFQYEFDFEMGDCGGLDSIKFFYSNGPDDIYLNADGHYSGTMTANNITIFSVNLYGSSTCVAYLDNFKVYSVEDTAYQICEIGSPMDSTLVVVCDSVTENNITYVTDHDFESGTEGWVNFGGSCPENTNAGRFVLDKCVTSNTFYLNTYNRQDGVEYYYEFDFEEGDCGSLDSIHVGIDDGTFSGLSITMNGDGHYNGSFIATGSLSNSMLVFLMIGSATCDAYFDNFKIYTQEDTTYWQCDSIYEKFGQSGHRYLFNSMENDPEVSGLGNSYTTEFRQYDPRLGRWKSRDFINKHWESDYAAFHNNPMFFTDPLGLDPPEEYSTGQKLKNWATGNSHKNKANKYAVENNIDESRIIEHDKYTMIDQGSYTEHKLYDKDGNMYIVAELNENYQYFFSGNANLPNRIRQTALSGWTWDPGVRDIYDMADKALNGFEELELKGEILAKVSHSPDIMTWNDELLNGVFADERYGKEDFSIMSKSKGFRFGPDHDGYWTASFFEAGADELTWAVRHAKVTANIIAQKSGEVHIYYHLNDVWDLEPSSSRSTEYNVVSGTSGFFWHTVLGATKPNVYGNWMMRYNPMTNSIFIGGKK